MVTLHMQKQNTINLKNVYFSPDVHHVSQSTPNSWHQNVMKTQKNICCEVPINTKEDSAKLITVSYGREN